MYSDRVDSLCVNCTPGTVMQKVVNYACSASQAPSLQILQLHVTYATLHYLVQMFLARSCAACPRGKHVDGIDGSAACSSCSAETYNDTSRLCEACAAGRFNDMSVVTAVTA